MKNKSVQLITYSAIIAAVYAVLTLVPPISTISYGMIQFRVSEALVAFSLFTPAGVWGVSLGCLIANIFNPYGFNFFDVVFGTSATILAASLTYILRNRLLKYLWLMPLPTVILNAFIVGSYLPFLLGTGESAWVFILSVGIGEAVVCYVLGIPLALIIKNRNILGK